MAYKVLFSVLVIFAVSGCSTNSMYRDSFLSECTYAKKGDCANSALQVANAGSEYEYRLGFIEYDDQGQFRKREQQDAVIDNYLAIAGQQDVIVMTFVHGWHHSAKSEDPNIKDFRKLLAKTSKEEARYSAEQQRDRRPVLGVFIGWRGDSIAIDWVNMVTFWDRKNVANTVGRQGISQALLKLEELVNVRNTFEDGQPNSTSRLVVIGHSFGGQILFSSLQNILADRYIDSRKSKSSQGLAGGFGDLVVLMNPAFEALRFSSLLELSQDKCRGYMLGQLPKLAILTSETDYATKIAFPLGRSVSTVFDRHDTMQRHECERPGSKGMKPVEISQGKADRRSVGHFDQYLTHRLEAAETSDKIVFDLPRAYSDWSASDSSVADVYSLVNLSSHGRTTSRNPYMNIEVSKDLMNGHNDIWGDKIIDFIHELVLVSITPIESYEKMANE